MSTISDLASQLDAAVVSIPAVREVYAADAALPRMLLRFVDAERARVDVRADSIAVAIAADSDSDCVLVAREVAAAVQAVTRAEGFAPGTVRVRVSRLISEHGG